MMEQIILKPNEEQRALIDYLKQTVGLEGVHGEDQKTIYWALEFTKEVVHLFCIDKLLQFKGFQSQDYKQFISQRYQNVAQNAKKSIPKNGFEVLQEPNEDTS